MKRLAALWLAALVACADPLPDNPDALVGLAIERIDGHAEGEPFDPELTDALREAAKGGHAGAANTLYTIFNTGLAEPGDGEDPLAYLDTAVAGGDPAAKLNYANRFILEGGEAAERAARYALELEADPDTIPESAYIRPVAVTYRYGLGGVAYDHATARARLERCVELDAAPDLCPRLLAVYVETGTGGGGADPAGAARLYRVAADAGDPQAQWEYAMRLLDGRGGLTPDAQAAYDYVRRAAEGGLQSARISQAVMLATGEGVAQDPAAAFRAYESALAVPGDGTAHALRGLSVMTYTGEGTVIDEGLGMAGLLIAAAMGDPVAPRYIQARAEPGQTVEQAVWQFHTQLKPRIAELQNRYGLPDVFGEGDVETP